jgi:hypothetical protein
VIHVRGRLTSHFRGGQPAWSHISPAILDHHPHSTAVEAAETSLAPRPQPKRVAQPDPEQLTLLRSRLKDQWIPCSNISIDHAHLPTASARVHPPVLIHQSPLPFVTNS